MTRIEPISETSATVTLRREDWEAMLDRLEDLQDIAAVAAHRAHATLVGKDIAEAGYLTVGEVRRLLDWENPVKVWREKRGLSQRDLAERAHVSPSYLAEIETGRKPGSAEALLHLSRALGVRMEDLAERDRFEMTVAYLKDIIDSGATREQAVAAVSEIIEQWHRIGEIGRHDNIARTMDNLKDRLRQLSHDYTKMGLHQQDIAAEAMADSIATLQRVA